MDSQFGAPYDSVNGYQSFNGTLSPGPEDLVSYDNFFSYKDPSIDLSSVDFPPLQTNAFPGNPTSSSSSSGAEEVGSPDDFDSEVLRYISQLLMEENMNEKPCMFHDPLAVQAAEKPFYDALGQDHPLSPNQHPLLDHFVDSPDDTFSSDFSTSTNGKSRSVDSVESNFQQPSISQGDFSSLGSVMGNPSLPVGFDIFSDRESMILFQKGVEEANKFLPKTSNLVIDLDNITFPKESKDTRIPVKPEKRDYLSDGLRTRKIHYLDDEDLEEGRSNKQSALSVEETEDLSEMFDRVLLCPHPKSTKDCDEKLVKGLLTFDLDSKARPKKQDDGENVVDLRTLLILCAQAVASDDRRTANEQLKKIRQHSSPHGDGSQRLAHYFANALEARLEGTGSQLYTALASKKTTTVQKLKAYQFFVSLCPFKKMSIMYSNISILKLAENRKKLHVIDFGICYGFQWPVLIQCLSQRPEGPPMLRITGIELPQSGFRPAERVEETGRRLAKYCERFGVLFEFIPIAQKWETVKVEDLKLEKDEVVAVNCLYRFKNLLDETIVVDSPRDAVMNLIRKIKPNLFVHGIVNGSFNAPFFITRFREALFYYSTLFDMFDTNAPWDNPERSMYEREFYGREIMNVVACEGTDRVERPELYKQWWVRNTKTGFRQLPLDPGIMEKGRHKMKLYHKDYALNVDGNWALMGWKGRVMYAISAWAPS